MVITELRKNKMTLQNLFKICTPPKLLVLLDERGRTCVGAIEKYFDREVDTVDEFEGKVTIILKKG